MKFGMPLDPETITVFRMFNAFDHAVFGRTGVDDDTVRFIQGRLMVGAVDVQGVAADDGA